MKCNFCAEWGNHVCLLRSSVNIGSMKDVQTVKDSAKSYIGDLIRFGRWKKEPARNQTAFPANSQGGGNSSENSRGSATACSLAAPHAQRTATLVIGALDLDTEVAACGWHKIRTPASHRTVKPTMLLPAQTPLKRAYRKRQSRSKRKS